jgi:hypothetical protein
MTDTLVAERRNTIRRTITREAALLLGFSFLVGQAIFGDYGGGSFSHFYLELSSRIRAGDGAAWFLVLSPYIGWQSLRLMGLGWRIAGRRPAPRGR